MYKNFSVFWITECLQKWMLGKTYSIPKRIWTEYLINKFWVTLVDLLKHCCASLIKIAFIYLAYLVRHQLIEILSFSIVIMERSRIVIAFKIQQHTYSLTRISETSSTIINYQIHWIDVNAFLFIVRAGFETYLRIIVWKWCSKR